MASIIKIYDYFFNEIMDPRVKDWTFMTSPIPLTCVIIIYLIGIYKILPKFMQNRKAYSLKNIIFYYNIFQIFACSGLIYRAITSDWTISYLIGCVPVDYSNNPIALQILQLLYYTFYVKMAEFLETIFFILRKKPNQVTKLHVYHHVSSLILAWIGCRYVAGGMLTVPLIINCFVHIVMYTYYLLTSLGSEWQKKLAKWKPRLTMLQMIQFCILILHTANAFRSNCHGPRQLLIIYLPNVIIIFYMFWNFYKKNYLTAKKSN